MIFLRISNNARSWKYLANLKDFQKIGQCEIAFNYLSDKILEIVVKFYT